MNPAYFAPILLLLFSNIFMTFAWVRSGLPQANEMVQWTISSDASSLRSDRTSLSKAHFVRQEKLSQRPELGRGAGRPAMQSMPI
jgi:hypothetical protein